MYRAPSYYSKWISPLIKSLRSFFWLVLLKPCPLNLLLFLCLSCRSGVSEGPGWGRVVLVMGGWGLTCLGCPQAQTLSAQSLNHRDPHAQWDLASQIPLTLTVLGPPSWPTQPLVILYLYLWCCVDQFSITISSLPWMMISNREAGGGQRGRTGRYRIKVFVFQYWIFFKSTFFNCITQKREKNKGDVWSNLADCSDWKRL